MRYKATISYNGKDYCGWQIQPNGITIQEELEKALEKTFGVPTQATASGRTDAGVHALGQVVHFDAETSIPLDKMPYAINTHLPRTISVLNVEETSDNFNARFSAKRKTYLYKMYLSHHVLPMLEDTHSHCVTKLNFDLMEKACTIIEGTHDFKCFEAAGSIIKNTVRTIYSLTIEKRPLDGLKMYDKNGEIYNCELLITVTGNGFLYNMVRIIAGTLFYIGQGKITLKDLEDILENKDRTKAGKTLPPNGLYLVSVEYPENN